MLESRTSIINNAYNLCKISNPLVESAKFLGLRFQDRHSWLPHIKIQKVKFNRAINCLKYLPHPTAGCKRQVLFSLYKTLVRSIVDNG